MVAVVEGFYSLSRETYNGTCRRARGGGSVWPGFYSLSRETYNGTLPPPAPPLTSINGVRLHTRPLEAPPWLTSTRR